MKLDRPLKSYIAFGDGSHQCFGRELALTYLVGFLKRVTSLKNLRAAMGAMGELKKINRHGMRSYLSEDWSSIMPYASSKNIPYPSQFHIIVGTIADDPFLLQPGKFSLTIQI